MSYMFAIAGCGVCQVPFTFNPDTVPSFTPAGGTSKVPVCRGCMERVNQKRAELGHRPHPIHPLAYEPALAEGTEEGNDW